MGSLHSPCCRPGQASEASASRDPYPAVAINGSPVVMGPGSPSLRSVARDDDRTISLDRLRIDRGAGAAGDDQGRTAEEEFIDAVGRAVLRQLLEIEDLAHAQAHSRDHHPV